MCGEKNQQQEGRFWEDAGMGIINLGLEFF
jgi:hypothetical protein